MFTLVYSIDSPATTITAAIESQLDNPKAIVSKPTTQAFVLNSDDFRNLQKYHFAAAAPPPTETKFLSLFPEAQMA